MNATSARIPSATYRIQLHAGFGFRDAEAIVPYLHELGITDLYTSPILKAAPGSAHGYDVVDHRSLNPELGSEADFESLVERLRERGMGLLLDWVPNHMSIGHENRYWMDVLENGPGSAYAHYFDIDWHPVKSELRNRVLLPMLSQQYGAALEAGELQLEFDRGQGVFLLRYFGQQFPLAPRSYTQILRFRIELLESQLGEADVDLQELLSINTALDNLPFPTETDPARIAERQREKEVIKRRIAGLCDRRDDIRTFLEDNVRLFNGEPGRPESYDLLDNLLRDQAYRLAHWRVAGDEINYRRFFDINDLAAIRIEDPGVFEETHKYLFSLVERGMVTGLRIDHPDGLQRPSAYLEALRERAEALRAPLYVVVEKILMRNEPLPEAWPVHGTTGYDFANLLNGIFVAIENNRKMDHIYSRFINRRVSFQDLLYEAKVLIMRTSMASEINMLAHRLNVIAERSRHSRDFTLNSLRWALIELTARFPVYRPYIEPDRPPDERDRAYIENTVYQVVRRSALNVSVFAFIKEILLETHAARLGDEERAARLDFVLTWQQVTGPVMAKGMEDTAFYNFNRLVSVNEVGGDPEVFGTSVADFHARSRQRTSRWPASMLATSTHDAKRSEDVRARINVLSEIPDEWRTRVARWSRLNRRRRIETTRQAIPDRNTEVLLYQTLIGAWPLAPTTGWTSRRSDDIELALQPGEAAEFTKRMNAYMIKAARESKAYTSWLNPEPEYEEALAGFVTSILERATAPPSDPFLNDFVPFQRAVACCGMYNALSQVLLKVACPGVPDFYQGTELWALTLVDPDNRGAVDYDRRLEVLRLIQEGMTRDRREALRDLFECWPDGRVKLFVTYEMLRQRRRNAALFLDGQYLPLTAVGPRADHVCSFARRHDQSVAVAIAPRLTWSLTECAGRIPDEVWLNTWLRLPEDSFADVCDVFSGCEVQIERIDGGPGIRLEPIFGRFPVALLVGRVG